MRTLIIPVYKNLENLPYLMEALVELHRSLNNSLCVTFVVDGSPDASEAYLLSHLPSQPFASTVIRHSRNFGSFAAIRTGLEHSPGKYFAVMAADLQEPPSLVKDIFKSLESGEADIVLCNRQGRADPYFSRLLSSWYWSLYRKFVIPEVPEGGVDIFGCTSEVKSNIVRFTETRTSLIGQLMWVGYRRKVIGYERAKRLQGVSAWTLTKKLDYFLDSVFAFSDLPIRLLLMTGFVGVFSSIVLILVVGISRIMGWITVGGYTAIMLAICFFGALNLFALGIVGTYAQRAYDNSKGRPVSIVSNIIEINPNDSVSTEPNRSHVTRNG